MTLDQAGVLLPAALGLGIVVALWAVLFMLARAAEAPRTAIAVTVVAVVMAVGMGLQGHRRLENHAACVDLTSAAVEAWQNAARLDAAVAAAETPGERAAARDRLQNATLRVVALLSMADERDCGVMDARYSQGLIARAVTHKRERVNE